MPHHALCSKTQTFFGSLPFRIPGKFDICYLWAEEEAKERETTGEYQTAEMLAAQDLTSQLGSGAPLQSRGRTKRNEVKALLAILPTAPSWRLCRNQH